MMRMILPGLMLLAATATGAQVASNVAGPPDAAPASTPATPAAPASAAPAPAAPVVVVGPAAPTPAELAAIKYRTELVCKTSLITGSLVARRKTCLTRKQWAYVNDAHEDEARKLMMDNMGKPTSN